jgi:hypothetical protein
MIRSSQVQCFSEIRKDQMLIGEEMNSIKNNNVCHEDILHATVYDRLLDRT